MESWKGYSSHVLNNKYRVWHGNISGIFAGRPALRSYLAFFLQMHIACHQSLRYTLSHDMDDGDWSVAWPHWVSYQVRFVVEPNGCPW